MACDFLAQHCQSGASCLEVLHLLSLGVETPFRSRSESVITSLGSQYSLLLLLLCTGLDKQSERIISVLFVASAVPQGKLVTPLAVSSIPYVPPGCVFLPQIFCQLHAKYTRW